MVVLTTSNLKFSPGFKSKSIFKLDLKSNYSIVWSNSMTIVSSSELYLASTKIILGPRTMHIEGVDGVGLNNPDLHDKHELGLVLIQDLTSQLLWQSLDSHLFVSMFTMLGDLQLWQSNEFVFRQVKHTEGLVISCIHPWHKTLP
jgi:hypothetical protein